jgi:DNA end-binding protein Ku
MGSGMGSGACRQPPAIESKNAMARRTATATGKSAGKSGRSRRKAPAGRHAAAGESKRSRARKGKQVAQPRSGSSRNSPRSLWSGQLRLALVNVAVELYPAVKPGARIAFHLVDRKTGKRIHYAKTIAGSGPIADDRIAKAFEVSRGKYVLLENDEIEALKRVERHVIELVQFVEMNEIDPIWFDQPYYVAPGDETSDEGYAVLRDALRKTKRIGLGQFTMRGRDYIAALKPCGRGLLLETLRFSEELRKSAPFFTEVGNERPDPELLELASELIERKSGPFDPGRFIDRYSEDLRELIEEKARTHKSVHVAEEPSQGRGQVIDLVEALRRSVARGSKSHGEAA